MAHCEFCGTKIASLPFKCKYCGGTYCNKHRLPENHECSFELKPVPVVPTISRSASQTRPSEAREGIRSSSEFEGPKELKKYLNRQQKQRNKAQKIYQRSLPRSVSYEGEIKGTSIIVALILIFSVTALIFSFSGLAEYIYMSVYGLTQLYLWIIFTAPFIIFGTGYFAIFFLFIYIIFFYSMGNNLEKRFGRAFIIRLYITCTLFTGIIYLLIRLLLSFVYPIELYYMLPYGFASGALIGIISFICILFYNTEMTMLCMFVPVRMRGKSMLLFLILLIGVEALLSLYPIFLADLGGMLGAFLVHRNYTRRK